MTQDAYPRPASEVFRADHAYQPYGNPGVYPGCVRCPLPPGEHPPAGAVAPAIPPEGWDRLLAHWERVDEAEYR